MGLQSRIKKLEEQCGLRKRQRIFIVRHFSEDLEFPPTQTRLGRISEVEALRWTDVLRGEWKLHGGLVDLLAPLLVGFLKNHETSEVDAFMRSRRLFPR